MSDKKVTVIIPTIPDRFHFLFRAVYSVEQQTLGLRNFDMSIIRDEFEAGCGPIRNFGVQQADTEWVAFLDDDDEMHPHHLHALLTFAETTKADVVYPWFDWAVDGVVDNSLDPLRTPTCGSPLGEPFDPDHLRQRNYIPVTTLIRREALLDAGGWEDVGPGEVEDWPTWLRLLDAGAKFEHLPDRTWVWHQHSHGNLRSQQ